MRVGEARVFSLIPVVVGVKPHLTAGLIHRFPENRKKENGCFPVEGLLRSRDNS